MSSSMYPDALLASLAALADVPAFEHGSRVLSRREFLDLTARYAGGLRSAAPELSPGSSIGVATGVTPDGVALQLAAQVLGLRVIALKPGLSEPQLGRIMKDVAVLVYDDTVTAFLSIKQDLAAKVLNISALIGEPIPLEPQGRPDDVAYVFFTSGSTGEPKGVESTFARLSVRSTWDREKWHTVSKRLGARYSRYLLFGTLASRVMWEHLGLVLTSGGTAVISTDIIPAFPQVLAELRISAFLCTVARFYHIMEVLRTQEYDLSHLQSIIIAGSTLPPDKFRAAIERFGTAAHYGYGTSETGMASFLTAEDVAEWPDSIHSVGRTLSHLKVEIRDEAGVALPTSQVGRIWVHTPDVFSGYTNEDASDVLVDGWVDTKDIGHLDSQGFLYLTSRARDVIIVNAILYYAGPIEAALCTRPEVDEAYVVGIPDETTGDAVVAFVVLSPTHKGQLNVEGLRKAVVAKLGPSAAPKRIIELESVPLLPSGKPNKNALLDQLAVNGAVGGW